MQTEIAALQKQFATLNATMASARNAASAKDRPDVYRNQIKQLSEIREMYRLNAVASGDWHAQTVKTLSASQRLTEQIKTNKVSAMQAFKEIGKYQMSIRDKNGRATSALREAMREQTALRNAMTSQMTGNAFGPNKMDLLTPRRLGGELDSIRTRYGMINQMISAAARNTINWGKNTQWAGRQISVGFTMPLMLAASAAGYLAFKVDKELTNIARVYDSVATDAAGKERELDQLRTNSLRDATAMTQQYGVAVTDVLEIQSKLAATGLNGNALQQYSRETMRIATLGDFDPEVAADMTISLTTAFRDEVKTVGDLSEIYDFYNVVAQETSVQMEDMAQMIPRAASALSALGVSAKEAAVLMTAMRESGVDPAVAANALKSATSTLLNPSKEAIEYWKTTLGKDLPAIVKDTGGNLFEFMKRVGEELHGWDPQVVQTAITKTFGKYQFDRLTALIGNFGDAMTGTANQTATAMDLLGLSAEELAQKSDQELAKLQESMSFKFKAAIESIKAALVPFGESVLKVLTPVIEFVGWLIRGFNDMNPVLKNTLMILMVGGAIVGPLLMLVGIFANLMGNVVRAGSAMANLVIRFRAVNAEEAAAAIATRNANSMFDMQTRSASTLAATITRLTASLEGYAAAAGLATTAAQGATAAATTAAGATGYIAAMPLGARPGGATRSMTSASINQGRYGIPYANQQASGAARQAAMSMVPTVAAIQSGKVAASAIANDAAKTQKSFSSIGRNMGMIAGMGLMAFPLFARDADGANEAFINIAMIAGMLLLMFPGMISSLLGGIKRVGIALAAAFSGPAIAAFFANMKLLFLVGARSGFKAMGTTLAAMAPRFAAIAASALKIGLPIAALATAAWVIKGIVDDMHQIAEDSKAMGSTAEAWSETIGYSFNPGQMPGISSEDATEANRISELAKEMAKNVDGLGEAFAGIDDDAQAFDRAMQQALKVLTTGGSIDDARAAFEASLEMMNLTPYQMDQLLLDFDEVDLSNPEAVREQLMERIRGLLESSGEGSVALDIDIRPSESADGVGQEIAAHFQEVFGGDLSGQAAALGTDLGDTVGMAYLAALDNTYLKFNSLQLGSESAAEMFSDEWDEILSSASDGLLDLFEQFDINNIDQFMTIYEDLRNLYNGANYSTDDMTGDQRELWEGIAQDMPVAFQDTLASYDQFLDMFIDGMQRAGAISEAEAADMKDETWSIIDLRDRLLHGATGTILPEDAKAKYEQQIQAMLMAGAPLDEQMQLAILNGYRAMAGLDKATTVAQGFGEASVTAAGGVVDLNNAMDTTEISAEQWAQTMRTAMEGAMNDIYSEASRLYDEQNEAELDSLRDSLDNTMDYYDTMIDGTNDNYDHLEKMNEDHWDAVLDQNDQAQEAAMNAAESYWDSQVESIENAKEAYIDEADARIESLRAQIEAEQSANDEREKLFEAEQRRIERMAERLNTNIDFNMALNSGDLDSAARIANDVSSRESKWSLEDQQRGMSEASEARIDTLEGRIDEIETEKDARTEAFDLQLEQTKQAKDAAIEALNERQEAERKALDEQRKMDEERLKSSRDTAIRDLEYKRDYARQGMEAFIEDVQKQNEIDKRGLEQRLRELQAFTPRNEAELQQHIKDVEALYSEYGINLTGQGNAWASVIGGALSRNIKIATMQMQNDINWEAIGNQISTRISGGIGVTAGDLQFFLRNGRFPFVASGNDFLGIGGAIESVDRMVAGLQGIDLGRHSGGLVFHNGGSPAFSQADRVGVPRSAGVYPSEVKALLKRGEYVVNEKATRKNYGLLEAINSGSMSQGDFAMSRHDGGIADTAPLIMGGVGQMLGQTLETAIKANALRAKIFQAHWMVGMIDKRVQDQMAAANAGSTGTLEGGNAPWQRLWNTIKRQFPEARLNDSTRPGASDYHGQGMAVDLGWMRAPGGNGNAYMASMNRWIYDNFHGSTELIYNGLGDDRPNLKNGRDFAYSAALQAQHRNHVHWAMTPQAIEAAGIAINSGIPGVASGNVQQQVLAEANRWGFGSGTNWSAIDWVVNRESSWNPNAQNPTSTASGLFQHIDGTWNSYKRPGLAARKMRLAPVAEQAFAGMNYFKGRYGNPTNARAFWERNHWYDNGGWMKPGEGGINGLSKPEPVFTPAQWDVLKSNIGNATYDVPGRAGMPTPVRVVNDNVATGQANQYNITVDLRGAYIKEEIDLQSAVEKAIDVKEARLGRRRVISG